MDNLILFFRLTRPIFIVGVAILYALGVGIAHYLGFSIDLETYVLGQIWVTLLQLSAQYLNEYFDYREDQNNQNRTPITGGSGALGPGKLPRRVALISAFTSFAILASSTVIIMSQIQLSPFIILIMIFAFAGSVLYSTPPLRLEGSGYGELLASVIIAFLVPLFAFFLQAGEFHRLLPMTTFSLTTLLISTLITFELPDYASDLKYGKQTLVVRLGCDYGFTLHNILLLSSYLLLGIAAVFGLPNFVLVSGVLTLPVGLFQIWQMRRIASGLKPNWTVITTVALAIFSLMTYLITFAYWIN
jgi:1,4-dihydroxy-2-naphthoate octaprenyltransferase